MHIIIHSIFIFLKKKAKKLTGARHVVHIWSSTAQVTEARGSQVILVNTVRQKQTTTETKNNPPQDT